MKTTTNRKRNKHGRTGCRRPIPGPSVEMRIAAARQEAYDQAHVEAREKARSEVRDLLLTLLEKRRVKDMHGLIERYLGA